MRNQGIWVLFALGAVSLTACGGMEKLAKDAQAGVAQAQSIQKSVDAAKKGDVSAAGDAGLSSAVKGALEKDPKTRGVGIEVEVKGGVVHLKGHVAADIKPYAEKVAKGVPGVSKVSNELNGGKSDPKADSKDPKAAAAK